MGIAALVPLLPLTVSLPAPGLDGTPTIVVDDAGWDAAIGAAGQASTDEPGGGMIGVSAVAAAVGDHDDVDVPVHVRAVAATGGSAGVRSASGDAGRFTASHWAHASYDWLQPSLSSDGGGAFAMAIEHHLDVGAEPSLFASRDTARAGFTREQINYDVKGFTYLWDGHRFDLIDEGFGFAWTWQPNGARGLEIGMHGLMARYCHEACAEILGFTAQVAGDRDSTTGDGVIAMIPLRLTNVGVGDLRVDASAGLELGFGDDGIGAYEVAIRDGAVEARAHRHAYLTLDDQRSIEDRADLAIGWGDDTRVSLRAFLAKTTWTTGAAITGGGEVAVARRVRGLDWDASLGVARSYYAAPDGATVDAPALGARGSIEVRRTLRGRALAGTP